MKYTNDESTSVNVKRKNISALLEYCVDNKIQFAVKPLISRSEEFEVEFELSNTKKAVALGMFLKELKLELNGLQPTIAPVVNNTTIPKSSKKTNGSVKENGHAKEEVTAAISFDTEKLAFDVEAATAN